MQNIIFDFYFLIMDVCKSPDWLTDPAQANTCYTSPWKTPHKSQILYLISICFPLSHPSDNGVALIHPTAFRSLFTRYDQPTETCDWLRHDGAEVPVVSVSDLCHTHTHSWRDHSLSNELTLMLLNPFWRICHGPKKTKAL